LSDVDSKHCLATYAWSIDAGAKGKGRELVSRMRVIVPHLHGFGFPAPGSQVLDRAIGRCQR
jgi:hypothetical protein